MKGRSKKDEDYEETASNIYVALLHYPVYNRNGETVTSAVTNLDIHDIARTARTYSLGGYFIITPDEEQRNIAQRICRHWLEGYGATYNVERGTALRLVHIVPFLDDAVSEIRSIHGESPRLLATTASEWEISRENLLSFWEAKMLLCDEMKPSLLLFGTGWGLSKDVLEKADHILSPVKGRGDYNHLSVRSASAIVIDRLLGNY